MIKRSIYSALAGAFLALTGAQTMQALPPAEIFPDQAAVTVPPAYGRAALTAEIDTTGIALGRKFLLLKLPGGGTVKLENTYFEDRGDDKALWRGLSSEHGISQAVLTLYEGNLSGRIVLDNEVYEIKPGPGSLHTLVLLNQDAFPECDTADHDIVDGGGSPSSAAAEQTGSVIDLLAVYTDKVVQKAGGVASAEAMIQAAVDNANVAFFESNVDAQYRLVHVEQVNYNNAPDTGAALSWVSNDAGVAALRDQYGADMVSVIVDTPSSCGTGYVQRNPGPGFASYAFQATDIDCAVGNLTFAHEHGHNAGMEHNPENSSVGSNPGSASYPYSFGHFINGSYRTVMSYSSPCTSGCSRVARHSSASIVYNGVTTGIADQRENARTANDTAPIIADFRPSVVTGAPVVNVRISQSQDDIEESNTNGSILTDSSDLEFGYDEFVSSEQLVGLRFLNLNIPKGATVTSAYLGFTVDETGDTVTTATIRALDADSVAAFSTAPYSLSNRATVGQVSWNIPAWSTLGELHQSPDISSLVQSVVNRPGWAEGNAMGFTVAATGDRTVEAWDGVSSSAPLLHIEYDVDAPPPPSNVPPTAGFSYSTNNLEASFIDTSDDSDGSIAVWNWSFGDGNTSSDQNPNHSYGAGGTYIATLTVTDDDGATDAVSREVAVSEPEPQPPADPTNLTKRVVQSGKGKNKSIISVDLSWDHSGDPATHFVLERCLESTTGKGKNRTTTCDYSVFSGSIPGGVRSISVPPETDYRYRLKAVNDLGESGYSNSVKI